MPLRKLEPTFHERVWGTTKLDPWFPNSRAKAGPFPIGEVWFETPEIPLLVKFLFAADKLSVQVHPDDAYAQFHHSSPGKTEMWHVLAAEPGAQIAAGFRREISSEQARAAALSGEIVELIEWFEARPGDTFFIPAGTVHAIGGGLTICEIQQRSDVTYRFYDYQRKPERELHLDHALAVCKLGPHTARAAPIVSCDYFFTEPFSVSGEAVLPAQQLPQLLIALEGEGRMNGETIRAGEVWYLTVRLEPAVITGHLRLLRTFVPQP